MLAEEETQQQQQQQQQLPAEMDRSHRGYTRVGNENIIDVGDGDDGLSESPSLERHASMRQIVTEEVQHVATETWLITRLSLTLLWFLGFGIRWIGKLLRLCLYALFLMPGFIQVGYYYFFSKNIQRSLEYGAHPRNRFDLYRPAVAQTAQMGVEDQVQSGRPVVIFITGGAWVIGYKAWGALLARQLVEQNIIVTCIDYRNFPQGCVGNMVADVSRGIGYVVHNIESWGGDLNKIYLVGQSAGAHLGACALLMQAKEEAKEQAENSLTWKASQMKAYFALSGGYNMSSLVEHFNRRGFYKKIFLRIMEGEESLPKYSPECIVRASSFREAVPFLPPLITLIHGKADYTIPHEASEQFADALRTVCRSVGADKKVEEVYFDDKTHTDLFLQDPMRGGKNDLLAELLKVINEDDEGDKVAMMRPRLVPECLLQLARFVSPF